VRQDDFIASKELDTSQLAPAERLDAWNEYCRKLSEIQLADKQDADKPISTKTWEIDQVLLTAGQNPQFWNIRRKEHLGVTEEFIRLKIFSQEGSIGTLGDTVVRVPPGQIHFQDIMQPYTTMSGSNIFVLFVPYTAIDYDPSRHDHQFCTPMTSGAGRLVLDAMTDLKSKANTMRRGASTLASHHITGLIRTLLLREEPNEASRAAVRTARQKSMRLFLDKNLANQAIGVVELCQAFSVGRATVFRDFAEVGGVDQYLRGRRLDHAFQDLLSKRSSRGVIASVAAKWSFDNATYFSRSFRNRFGLTPRDILGVGPASPVPNPMEAIGVAGDLNSFRI
jgi:AraC-like DNA-binding protein